MFSVEIETKKNLLAFSAGIDSTALFFILLEKNIPFDIAIVDYAQREQSKLEIAYAKELANKYNKNIFLTSFPSDEKFSEKNARDFRYNFFQNIIEKNNYETLITAHQLNDKLEWFLMQLSSGSGLVELLGMKEKDQRKNYIALKPLLNYSKDELQNYLDKNNITYFVDETNSDEKYMRNHIRKKFSNEFLKEFNNGVKKSFEYLEYDLEDLDFSYEKESFYELTLFSFEGNISENKLIRLIDKELKRRGILVSSTTRNEILKQKQCVVSHKIAIALEEKRLYMAPYCTNTMPKSFKESCRLKKIPSNIRAYIFSIDPTILERIGV